MEVRNIISKKYCCWDCWFIRSSGSGENSDYLLLKGESCTKSGVLVATKEQIEFVIAHEGISLSFSE